MHAQAELKGTHNYSTLAKISRCVPPRPGYV